MSFGGTRSLTLMTSSKDNRMVPDEANKTGTSYLDRR